MIYKKFLLCYDGTAEGRRALRQGGEVTVAMHSATYLLAICRRHGGEESVPEGVTPQLVAVQEDSAKALLAEGVKWIRERGITAEGALVYGDPLVHIPQVAERIGADLIVVGYRYRGRFARWWNQFRTEHAAGPHLLQSARRYGTASVIGAARQPAFPQARDA